ncbi:hypothetical protein [Aestuariibaculum marinum]|uniref:hypothetical protein n=1 Tax=Aestuariibaculum marinum TaxID=2683592 RepID=UPI001F5124BC|nr:hypothetical protein [Aestuariibaculum marinum]
MEELYVFTILEESNELIKQALNDHVTISDLFENTAVDGKTLSVIAETLDNHIRFEERVLFPKIQEVATESQFLEIEKIHQSDPFEDNLSDEFWK